MHTHTQTHRKQWFGRSKRAEESKTNRPKRIQNKNKESCCRSSCSSTTIMFNLFRWLLWLFDVEWCCWWCEQINKLLEQVVADVAISNKNIRDRNGRMRVRGRTGCWSGRRAFNRDSVRRFFFLVGQHSPWNDSPNAMDGALGCLMSMFLMWPGAGARERFPSRCRSSLCISTQQNTESSWLTLEFGSSGERSSSIIDVVDVVSSPGVYSLTHSLTHPTRTHSLWSPVRALWFEGSWRDEKWCENLLPSTTMMMHSYTRIKRARVLQGANRFLAYQVQFGWSNKTWRRRRTF